MSGTVPELFQQHAVWEGLDDLDAALTNAEELLSGQGPEVASVHASLTAVSAYVRSAIKSANPLLVPSSQLDIAEQAIDQVASGVTSFVKSEDAADLVRAWAHANTTLIAVSPIPTVGTRRSFQGLNEAVDNFHQHLSGRVTEFETQIDEVRAELDTVKASRDALNTEIDEQKGLLAAAIASFKEQYETEEKQRDTDVSAAIASLQSARSTFETESAAARATAKSASDTQLSELKGDFETKLKEWTDRVDAEDAARIESTRTIIEQLEAELAKAKTATGMVGEVVMTGHYQRNALEQKKVADNLRRATIVVSALAVISAIAATVTGIVFKDDLQVSDIITHATVTLALSGLAGFLGTQSHRHRQREESYRNLELELATMDPFLTDLDPQQRQQTKTELAKRYFKGLDREFLDDEGSGT